MGTAVNGIDVLLPLRTHDVLPAVVVPAPARVSYRTAQPAPSPPAATEAEARYTVRSGDTLSGIVKKHLEQQGLRPSARELANATDRVAEANQLRNANKIFPGQALALEQAKPAEPSASRAATLAPEIPASAAMADALGTMPPPPLIPRSQARYTLQPADIRFSEQRRDALAQPAAAALAERFGNAREVAAPPASAPAPTPIARVALAFRDLAARPDPPTPDGAAGGPEVSAAPVRGAQTLRSAARLDRLNPEVKRWVGGMLDEWSGAQSGPSNASFSPMLGGPGRISSGFGLRKDPFTGRRSMHNGIDFAAAPGTAVYPMKPGTVTFSGWQRGYGQIVIVDHGDGLESCYGHTSANLVKVGDAVDVKTPIAKVGSTGRSTGPHLHFEVREHGRPVNPLPYAGIVR